MSFTSMCRSVVVCLSFLTSFALAKRTSQVAANAFLEEGWPLDEGVGTEGDAVVVETEDDDPLPPLPTGVGTEGDAVVIETEDDDPLPPLGPGDPGPLSGLTGDARTEEDEALPPLPIGTQLAGPSWCCTCMKLPNDVVDLGIKENQAFCGGFKECDFWGDRCIASSACASMKGKKEYPSCNDLRPHSAQTLHQAELLAAMMGEEDEQPRHGFAPTKLAKDHQEVVVEIVTPTPMPRPVPQPRKPRPVPAPRKPKAKIAEKPTAAPRKPASGKIAQAEASKDAYRPNLAPLKKKSKVAEETDVKNGNWVNTETWDDEQVESDGQNQDPWQSKQAGNVGQVGNTTEAQQPQPPNKKATNVPEHEHLDDHEEFEDEIPKGEYYINDRVYKDSLGLVSCHDDKVSTRGPAEAGRARLKECVAFQVSHKMISTKFVVGVVQRKKYMPDRRLVAISDYSADDLERHWAQYTLARPGTGKVPAEGRRLFKHKKHRNPQEIDTELLCFEKYSCPEECEWHSYSWYDPEDSDRDGGQAVPSGNCMYKLPVDEEPERDYTFKKASRAEDFAKTIVFLDPDEQQSMADQDDENYLALMDVIDSVDLDAWE